jgi:hypothetical protein
MPHPHPQEVAHHGRRAHDIGVPHAGKHHPLRGRQDLLGLRWPIDPGDITYQEDSGVDRRFDLRHGRLGIPGGIARDRHLRAAAQRSGFGDGSSTQALAKS